MEPAPYHLDVAEGPAALAFWGAASDGVRLRIGIWPGGNRGTVLLFPGRAEYLEKYGRAAAALCGMGFALIAVDWRGQGLADRLADDPSVGHVERFADYQMDVATLIGAARDRGLPRPWHLLGHSMGGAIGLRALVEGLPVESAAFSGPMWRIAMPELLRPVVRGLGWAARKLGQGFRYTPGTGRSYLSGTSFDGNVLTRDPEMFAYMLRQAAVHSEFALGGPSLNWLREAVRETRRLSRIASPEVPALAIVGTRERVVETARIVERMRKWPGGRLEWIEGGEHEVLMETPERRERAFELLDEHFRPRATT